MFILEWKKGKIKETLTFKSLHLLNDFVERQKIENFSVRSEKSDNADVHPYMVRISIDVPVFAKSEQQAKEIVFNNQRYVIEQLKMNSIEDCFFYVREILLGDDWQISESVPWNQTTKNKQYTSALDLLKGKIQPGCKIILPKE